MRHLFLHGAALAAAASLPLAARAQSPVEQARASGVRQGEIQAGTQKLGAELDSMIDEYQRNGLAGDDLKNLKDLRGTISKLSDDDMRQILAILQTAGAKSDPQGVLKALADAYSRQKGMLSRLHEILAAYADDQEALELSHSVEQLADREAANLATGIQTARWELGSQHNAEALDAAMEGQTAEQKSIGDELRQLNARMGRFTGDSVEKALAGRFKEGIQQADKALPSVDAASASLDQKQLFNAVTDEKAARDQLRTLARTIAPPRAPADAMRDAAAQLDKLIAQQGDTLAATADGIVKPLPDWIASEFAVKDMSVLYRLAAKRGQLNQPLAQLVQQPWVVHHYESYKYSRQSLSSLEDREGDLADQTDALSQQLEPLVKAAADALHTAAPPMRSARGALTENNPASAIGGERSALTAMKLARAALQQSLASAESDLQKQIQDLLARQTTLTRDTATAGTPQQAAANAQRQAELRQAAGQVQQQAATSASPAAQPLADAAGNMEQAAAAMTDPAKSAQALSQQAQALKNLAKAGSALAQQPAQQTAQAPAEEQSLDKLASIIAAEEKVHLDTGLAAPRQAQKPDAIRSLAPRQSGIHADMADFAKTLPPADASPAETESASSHMAEANKSLDAADGGKAAPAEAAALQDLYALRGKLEASAAAAEKAAGANQENGAAHAEAAAHAAASLAKAQAETAKAQATMAGAAQAPAAASPLAQAATDAGAAAAPAGLPAEARQAMEAAAQALSAGSAQAAAGQKGQAQASAAKAQGAMAQAAAALGQGGPGEGSPGSPGTAAAGPPSPSLMPGTGGGPGQTGSQGAGGPLEVAGAQAKGKGEFLALPERDRATIQQSQSEKYPPSYATKVEQYLRNLSDESSHP